VPRDTLETLALVVSTKRDGGRCSSVSGMLCDAPGAVGVSPGVELVPWQQSHVLNDIIIMP